MKYPDNIVDPYGYPKTFVEDLAHIGRHPTFARLTFTIAVPVSIACDLVRIVA